ncbi:MAG: hypothetical protein NC935_01360 [Candidatus Omnitrophica bacterium]|nr:hypothetical protein [Candidatus Omnitrophota bacterium]
MKKNTFVLIFVMGVMVALGILNLAILSHSISEARLAKKNLELTQAFWLAEAGVQKALYSINNDDWDGWGGNLTDKNISITLSGSGGEYFVTVNGIGSSNINITSKGAIPSIGAVNKIEREIVVSASTKSKFLSAIFGETSVTLSGNAHTDSYDSNRGAYGGSNKASNGDVGTSAGTAGAISLSGNAIIDDNATTGPSGTVVLSGNAKVTGTIDDTNNTKLETVTVPSSLSELSSSGSINVSGNNSKTLSSGNYKYSSISVSGNGCLTISGDTNIYLTSSSALSVTGNAKLVITGKVKIYTDGNLIISGNGIVNNTQLPQNLLVYGTSSSKSIQISGNGDFYGAVYAPDATISVSGNGEVYGSLVGDTVSMSGNGGLHYDEALSSLADANSYSLDSWKESHNIY